MSVAAVIGLGDGAEDWSRLLEQLGALCVLSADPALPATDRDAATVAREALLARLVARRNASDTRRRKRIALGQRELVTA